MFLFAIMSYMLVKKTQHRGVAFSPEEVNDLLNSICSVLPIGGEEWDMVEHVHTAAWPDCKRTKESLRRKFRQLYNKKCPTGDPNCPDDVRRAKRLHAYIKAKTDMDSL